MNTTDVDLDTLHFKRSTAQYIKLTLPEDIHRTLAEIDEAALDFETTSLSPWDGDIRITSVCNDDIHFIIDHRFAGPFEKYAESFVGKKWYVYNAKFEARWLDQYLYERCSVPTQVDVLDVDFMAKSVIGGHHTSLAKMAKRDLGLTLAKDEQASDWSRATLSDGQYHYAAYDSYVTWLLYKKWAEEMNEGHWDGFKVFNDAVRGTIECEVNGLPLDLTYHRGQIWTWQLKRDTFEVYLRRYASESDVKNLRSRVQIGNFIKKNFPKELVDVWPKTEKRGDLVLDRAFMKSVAKLVPYPINRWTAAYIGFTYYDKYLSTYGEPLIENYKTNGAVLSRFNIAQAATGRYSSSSSNLQNIPRKIAVRRAFRVPSTSSYKLILADYKGVEIRTLAELSDDNQLRYDAIYGDVHAASAATIYHMELEEFEAMLTSTGKDYYRAKEMRSKAKGFTFQLLYGAQAAALSLVLGCSIREAEQAIIKWAERYERAYNYRFKMFDYMTDSGGFLPIHSGRRVYVFRDDRTYPVAANYPIQGAAADVMYRAVYHTHRLFDEYMLDANLCATVHDELLSRSRARCAGAAMDAQIEAMTLAWLDIFPDSNTDNLVDYAIGDDWSAKP